jgi:hypothetical protein
MLEAVVAIDVTAPLGEEVAQNGSELAGVDAGVEIRNDPASEGANTVDGLVKHCLHPGLLLKRKTVKGPQPKCDKSNYGKSIETLKEIFNPSVSPSMDYPTALFRNWRICFCRVNLTNSRSFSIVFQREGEHGKSKNI